MIRKNSRGEADVRNEKIGYKIREQTLQRIPCLLIADAREREMGSVAIRCREGQYLGVLPLTQAVARLLMEARAPHTPALKEAQRRLCARLNCQHTIGYVTLETVL